MDVHTLVLYLGVGLDLKVTVTQVTLHSELEDGCGVIVAHFALFCIVAHTHTHMRAAAIAPDIVGKLKLES